MLDGQQALHLGLLHRDHEIARATGSAAAAIGVGTSGGGFAIFNVGEGALGTAASAEGGELIGEFFGAFFRSPETFLQVAALIGAEGRGPELDEFLVLLPSESEAADRGAGENDEQVSFGGFHE